MYPLTLLCNRLFQYSACTGSLKGHLGVSWFNLGLVGSNSLNPLSSSGILDKFSFSWWQNFKKAGWSIARPLKNLLRFAFCQFQTRKSGDEMEEWGAMFYLRGRALGSHLAKLRGSLTLVSLWQLSETVPFTAALSVSLSQVFLFILLLHMWQSCVVSTPSLESFHVGAKTVALNSIYCLTTYRCRLCA